MTASSAAAATAAPAASTPEEEAFLRSTRAAAGVVVLPGLQYTVLRSGPADGPHPKRSDDIVVRYRGVLPDGRVFSASPQDGAETMRFTLQKLIPGWIAALQLMRPGDVWRLFVPAYLAYGAAGKNAVPPMSALTFTVELVSIVPPAAGSPP
jgi:FKBP-type peptidyl-prolyl cis-trans isomerase